MASNTPRPLTDAELIIIEELTFPIGVDGSIVLRRDVVARMVAELRRYRRRAIDARRFAIVALALSFTSFVLSVSALFYYRW